MCPEHCRPVPLPKAYRLLNHGPTVLVSAAHDGQRTIMAAAWAMPLDFEPPKVAVVLDKATWTRQLLEGAGTFAVQVPCAAQADLVQTVGTTSGRDLDKFAAYDLRTFTGEHTDAPLLEGCVAWLECRLLPEPHNQQTYDLFIGEVTHAFADRRVFRDGHWHFDDQPEALRTLHYVAGGQFYVTGASLKVRAPESP